MVKVLTFFAIASGLLLTENSYAMMEENTNNGSSPVLSRNIPVAKEAESFDLSFMDKIHIKMPKKSEFDIKLLALNGKNLSGYPLTEEMFNFIENKVGKDNDKTFVFETGPKILFEDEVDLFRQIFLSVS